MRIYITHCSKEKLQLAKETGDKYPPDQLYIEPGIQQFIAACKNAGVLWAILSDNYGIFFPDEKKEYYEKPPSTVTPDEEALIISSFERKLAEFDEIWFYIRPSTFHPFYGHVLTNSKLSGKVKRFEKIDLITK